MLIGRVVLLTETTVTQLSLQRIYHNQPAVSCQLLKLAADVVDAQISFVQVADDFLHHNFCTFAKLCPNHLQGYLTGVFTL